MLVCEATVTVTSLPKPSPAATPQTILLFAYDIMSQFKPPTRTEPAVPKLLPERVRLLPPAVATVDGAKLDKTGGL